MLPDVTNLQQQVARLEAAIRKHRDYRGDDRCWRDDEELYAVLPEGYSPPAREVAVEKAMCDLFIASRRHPATEYVSPQRRIEELEAEVVTLRGNPRPAASPAALSTRRRVEELEAKMERVWNYVAAVDSRTAGSQRID